MSRPARKSPPRDSSPPPVGEAGARRHRRAVLAWYDRARRTLPWRAAPGTRADPYRVWLSEIMLQQTTVATVAPYFQRFVARWPEVGALAAASLDEVLAEWQGLGYYSRARNLKACADRVAAEFGGRFPDTVDGLRALPGIGPYTAAAIAAIAFDIPASVVDGNVERVIARIYAVTTPLPAAKPELRALAAVLTPARRAGDYAQAMMDLGATVCVPRNPRCAICPLADHCAGRAAGIAAGLPRRARKTARPVRRGIAWVAFDRAGRVLLRRRPAHGLLGAMWEVPGTAWTETGPDGETAPPLTARWREGAEVAHVFTHFRLELAVRAATVARSRAPGGARWVAPGDLGGYALPSVMKKVLAAGRAALGKENPGEGPRGT